MHTPEATSIHHGHAGHELATTDNKTMCRVIVEGREFTWHETVILETKLKELVGYGHDQILVFEREDDIELFVEDDGEVALSVTEIVRLRFKPRPIVAISVNYKKVEILHGRRSGLQIKEAAIAQGVKIKLDFELSLDEHGIERVIGDHDKVRVHGGEEFMCVDHHEDS